MEQPEALGPAMHGQGPRRPWVGWALFVAVLAVAAAGGSLAVRAVDQRSLESPPPAAAEKATNDEAAAAKVARQFLAAWKNGNWKRLQGLISDQSLDAASVHRQAHETLQISRMRYRAGTPVVDGNEARLNVKVRWVLRGLGRHSFRTTVTLERARGRWRVRWWYPTVHPALTPQAHFERVRLWPARAPILGRGGKPLVTTGEAVSIGFEPRRVSNRRRVVDTLARTVGADRRQLREALTADGLVPTYFYPLVEVPRERFERAQRRLERVPGLVFRAEQSRVAHAPGVAERLLGDTDEITADGLEELGEPYAIGDLVGQSGLEEAYERRLAGEPKLEARIVDELGLVESLLFHDGREPQPLRTTLDLKVQRAAEQALQGVSQPVALVALRAGDSALLAAATDADDGVERALTGRYPPGSTFKIATATATLRRGGNTKTKVSCPKTVRVGSNTITNAGGYGRGRIALREAFEISCNTAFANQALAAGPQRMTHAAERYGFNTEYRIGLPHAAGSFPTPESPPELAQAGIGQARVLSSPLHMASTAAAVAAGSWNSPYLVQGVERKTRPLPRRDAQMLRSMMRRVVERGTGTAADLPGQPVYGKTGTAQFGTQPPFGTHAWFVGYRGNLAFAVVVEGGGGGGSVAAPVAARFLNNL